MILGAQKLFFRNERFLQSTEFSDREIQNSPHRFLCRAGIHREHTRIGVRRDFTEDSVSKAAFFANVLKKARRHSAAEQVVQYSDNEAAIVCDGERWYTDANMNLLEVGFAVELNRSAGLRSNV